MKQLKKDLAALLKELKALTRKTEAIEKKVKEFEKAKAPKKVKAKTRVKAKPAKKKGAGKPEKATAIDTVYSIIKKSKKGVDTATLKKKTGFNDKKVWNNINMLKVKGKIKSLKMGVYVKV